MKELYNIPEFKRYTNLPKKSQKQGGRPDYLQKIASRDFDAWLATDGSRKALSSDPENIYLRHPKGETVEEYQTEISQSQWNSKDQSVRADWHFDLSTDPAINPLKGKLKN